MNGIPGLLPLVLDLPVRFTESLNKAAREMGVFKHSRGWLRGWQLSEAEEQRLEQLPDAEVVLLERPLSLHIEVETATTKMPKIDGKHIFTLTVQSRQWKLDPAGNVRVLRFGFLIMPDFGGKAHAYCGISLDAILGDSLSWTAKPTREAAQRGNIIKSRIRKA